MYGQPLPPARAFSIQWQFDKRLSPSQRDEMIAMLRQEMSVGGQAANDLFKTLGLKQSDMDDWADFLDDLSEKIPEMIAIVD